MPVLFVNHLSHVLVLFIFFILLLFVEVMNRRFIWQVYIQPASCARTVARGTDHVGSKVRGGRAAWTAVAAALPARSADVTGTAATVVPPAPPAGPRRRRRDARRPRAPIIGSFVPCVRSRWPSLGRVRSTCVTATAAVRSRLQWVVGRPCRQPRAPPPHSGHRGRRLVALRPAGGARPTATAGGEPG